jgi:hypothetical protein
VQNGDGTSNSDSKPYFILASGIGFPDCPQSENAFISNLFTPFPSGNYRLPLYQRRYSDRKECDESAMGLTILLSLMLMAGLFLMLYSVVALIQQKRFFSSAPKVVLENIKPKEERFHGAHALGYVLAAAAVLCMASSLIIGAVDGIRNGFSYFQFLVRFLVMFLLLKVFDILFFDWLLLCHSHFYQRYYPELEGVLGPELFGFNKKSHLLQIVYSIAWASIIACVCSVFVK